jgi:hypothetical protein
MFFIAGGQFLQKKKYLFTPNGCFLSPPGGQVIPPVLAAKRCFFAFPTRRSISRGTGQARVAQRSANPSVWTGGLTMSRPSSTKDVLHVL